MPRGVYKQTTIRKKSVKLVDELLSEIFAAPDLQAKLAAGITMDASAMRVCYTAGDYAVRAMLLLEHQQQEQQRA